MFYFRIDRVRFLDNGSVKSGLGIFGHDYAKVKFVSFVTRSDQNVPQLDKWMKTNDPAAKEAALQKLVRQTLNTRDLTELDRVQDNVPVSFGDTGLVLYEAEEIPEAFTWTFVAVRSDQDLREAAGDANEILDEPGFSSFSTNILSLIQPGPCWPILPTPPGSKWRNLSLK
ncbi:MAG: hypothetical protein H0T83_02985 [Chthoniobacterales bacterium]|nr:hypothetical protein [Chthoniobacterales bacterium]